MYVNVIWDTSKLCMLYTHDDASAKTNDANDSEVREKKIEQGSWRPSSNCDIYIYIELR
jgi:hypothetical protein